jgi:hypothetical protein
MLRRVAFVRTEVSKECSTPIISVTIIGELGTTLAVISIRRMLKRNTILLTNIVFLRSLRRLLVTANVVPSSPILVTLTTGALQPPETSVLKRATQRNTPEYGILHSHTRGNHKYYIALTGWPL